MGSLNTKFHKKIFIYNKVIQLWKFSNSSIDKIQPKILVTLENSKFLILQMLADIQAFNMKYVSFFNLDSFQSYVWFSNVS